MKDARHSCRIGSSHVASDAEVEELTQQPGQTGRWRGVCPGLEEQMLAVGEMVLNGKVSDNNINYDIRIKINN